LNDNITNKKNDFTNNILLIKILYYMTSYILIIVESPAKCSKIESFLNNNKNNNNNNTNNNTYKCIASFGHIRELTSIKNINISDNFSPTYNIIKKNKQVAKLKKYIKEANEVILATDDDREGEAIAWHICDHYKLNPLSTKRMLFQEITKESICNAINNTTFLNMNYVYSQQTRQILDILMGFTISPILWKVFSQNKKDDALSAGRCQTPALGFIYDNQQSINNQQLSINYKIDGTFIIPSISPQLKNKKELLFTLNHNFPNSKDTELFMKSIINHQYVLSIAPFTTIEINSPKPFNTSLLLQQSPYSSFETMKICQKLYENGHITYMRTESNTYSTEFIDSVSKYININYTDEYFTPNINNISNTDKKDPHEAIRPTNIFLSTLDNCTNCKYSTKECAMYLLIWTRSLESCMNSARANKFICSISTPTPTYSFKRECKYITFMGWMIVSASPKSTKLKNITEGNQEYEYLYVLKDYNNNANTVTPISITTKPSCVDNYLHLTESALIKLLEKHTIGRPSTYSSLVNKIQTRNYAKIEDIKGQTQAITSYTLCYKKNKNPELNASLQDVTFGNEKKKLVIQDIGTQVYSFCSTYFKDIFNYKYTQSMELLLNDIAIGKSSNKDICLSFYNQLNTLVGNYEINQQIPNSVSNNNHNNHKVCDEKNNNSNINNNDEQCANKKTNIVVGTYLGKDLTLYTTSWGNYAKYEDNDGNCVKHKLDFTGNRPLENITCEEVVTFIENKPIEQIRTLTPNLSIRTGKYGAYIYYKKTNCKKKPKILKLKGKYIQQCWDCDCKELINWIKDTYSVV